MTPGAAYPQRPAVVSLFLSLAVMPSGLWVGCLQPLQPVQRIPHSSLEETLILLQDTLAKSEDKGGPPVGVIVGVSVGVVVLVLFSVGLWMWCHRRGKPEQKSVQKSQLMRFMFKLGWKTTRKMHTGKHPPTAFTIKQWEHLRDNLFKKYPKPATEEEIAIRNIAKLMNIMQHYYVEAFVEVQHSGKLILETCLDFYGQQGSNEVLFDKIESAFKNGHISADTQKHMHELHKVSTTKDFKPQDKVAVANKVYEIGVMIWSDL